jgi:putative redox protein
MLEVPDRRRYAVTTYDTVPKHETMLTACGRTVETGRVALPGATAERVTINVPGEDFDSDEPWMSLTPDEARELATRLARHAAAAEPAATTATPDGNITVAPLAGHAYEVTVRGHRLVVDQPAEARGTELGPQPLELFVAALAACVATFAGSYLARNGIDTHGLRVRCSYDLAPDRPTRVGSVRIAIELPDGVPPERRGPLLAVARHCTAHNTLEHPPSVDIDYA